MLSKLLGTPWVGLQMMGVLDNAKTELVYVSTARLTLAHGLLATALAAAPHATSIPQKGSYIQSGFASDMYQT